MELSSIFCKVHFNNHIEIDLDYKAYCSECVNDSIKNNLNNPQEIKSNIIFHDNEKNNNYLCKIHDKEFKFFCVTCKQYICSNCICTIHKSHVSGTIKQMTLKVKEILLQKQELLKDEIALLQSKNTIYKKDTEQAIKLTKDINDSIDKTILVNKKQVENAFIKVTLEIQKLISKYNSFIHSSKVSRENTICNGGLVYLNEIKKELENSSFSVFSQCLFIKNNYTTLKVLLSYSNIEESSNIDEYLSFDKQFNEMNQNIISKANQILVYLDKLDIQLQNVFRTNLPQAYYKFRRFDVFKLLKSKYITQTSTSFFISKSISLCGIGICGFDSKLPNGLPFNLSIYKENELIYKLDSTLKGTTNNHGCNSIIYFHFNEAISLQEKYKYSIQIIFINEAKNYYLDIWTGSNTSNTMSYIDNNSNVMFTFKQSNLSSDFHEEVEGIISDFLII